MSPLTCVPAMSMLSTRRWPGLTACPANLNDEPIGSDQGGPASPLAASAGRVEARAPWLAQRALNSRLVAASAAGWIGAGTFADAAGLQPSGINGGRGEEPSSIGLASSLVRFQQGGSAAACMRSADASRHFIKHGCNSTSVTRAWTLPWRLEALNRNRSQASSSHQRGPPKRVAVATGRPVEHSLSHAMGAREAQPVPRTLATQPEASIASISMRLRSVCSGGGSRPSKPAQRLRPARLAA